MNIVGISWYKRRKIFIKFDQWLYENITIFIYFIALTQLIVINHRWEQTCLQIRVQANRKKKVDKEVEALRQTKNLRGKGPSPIHLLVTNPKKEKTSKRESTKKNKYWKTSTLKICSSLEVLEKIKMKENCRLSCR